MKITVFGSGGAAGVPSVSAGWGDADPAEPRNRRLRSSILVEDEDTRILVDTSPDLRQQLLRSGVRRLDAVLFTHAHADHVHGIDDLREINRVLGHGLPAWSDQATFDDLHKRFAYVFTGVPEGAPVYRPWLLPNLVTPRFSIGDIEIQSWTQGHGWVHSLGFRFGDFAYTTDALTLGDDVFEIVRGAKVWMVGALTNRPNPLAHANVEIAVGWIERAGVERGILTHLGGGLDYQTLRRILPPHIEPAFDGMEIEIQV